MSLALAQVPPGPPKVGEQPAIQKTPRPRKDQGVGVTVLTFPPAMRAPNVNGREQPTGIQPKEWPWTSIGRVNIETAHCTGALIEADLVLTARHCIDNPRTGRIARPRQVFFLSGYALGDFVERAAVDHFELPPSTGDGTDTAPGADWVLLRLTKPTALQPIPLALLTPETILAHAQAGTRFFRVGYPRERPHMLRLQPGCQIGGMSADARAVMFDCNVMPGESGGPIMMQCEGHWRIVAMTAFHLDLDREIMSFGVIPTIADVGLTSTPAVCPAA